ncbi:FAD-dependent oxidoreductase domain-containing protein 1-like [Orbicella faveolata]|uniref:FAD-dependent oxidoreductase domain-containing protein 1-like n=2 Tax=Orbicella faveolata TaxID=48498 RepID=UPI0009E330B5|nr:FAD-dependent oxidoreductase domain-containing protein 1-like [Orbicella faveolata]
MATRGVFLRKTLTCLISRSNNRLRMNYLNCVRCLSLSYGTKASKAGSPKEKNIYDVAIVGGGAMGSSSAYFLASRLTHEMGKICVIERDPTYSNASTTLSLASIRQQFSLAENVQMSQQSFRFLSEIDQHLAVEGCDPPDIQLRRQGYLFLASKNGEEILKKNHALQRKLDCHVILLSPSELSERFPWINTDGIALASLGTGSEGWFDPWSLLNAFKRKAVSLDVEYITGEAVDFDTDYNGQINSIKVITSSSPNNVQTIHCGVVVNAAGPKAGHLAKKLGIHLPVEPRKRCVFVLDCPEAPGRDEMPLVVDCTGTYVRPEGGCYISGLSPEKEDDHESSDFEVDYDFFTEKIWPNLAHRIPAFECVKVQSAWAGHYEYNTLDQNAIIGRHPQIRNLIFVNGFSGHGIQQSPSAGRAVSELILDGGFQTIDLTALGYERVLRNEPMRELNIV